MKIFTDGGTRNNGQENQDSDIAVYAEGNMVLCTNIGNKTNNEAEYIALIEGAKYAKEHYPKKKIVFYTDSQLMQKQIAFEWGINTPHLIPLAIEARNLLQDLGATIKWIPREENQAGIYLEDTLGI